MAWGVATANTMLNGRAASLATLAVIITGWHLTIEDQLDALLDDDPAVRHEVSVHLRKASEALQRAAEEAGGSIHCSACNRTPLDQDDNDQWSYRYREGRLLATCPECMAEERRG